MAQLASLRYLASGSVRIFLLCLLLAMAAMSHTARAEEADPPLRVQLIWHGSAEFAGFLAAETEGYYHDAGVRVKLIPGGPGIDPLARLANNKADVAIDWLPAALAARKRGENVVNVAQTYQASSLALACRRSAGIKSPADLRNKKIAVWNIGDQAAVKAFLNKFGIGMNQVTLVQQGFEPTALINGKVACGTVMLYNEYWALIANGLSPASLLLFRFDRYDTGFLENGWYILGNRLNDSTFVARLSRLLAASAKGWKYAREHPDDTLAMVMASNPTLNRERQKRMLEIVLKSVGTKQFGLLKIGEYEKSVHLIAENSPDTSALLAAGKDGWTHGIWEHAQLDARPSHSLTRTTAYYLAQTANTFWFHIFDLIGTAAFGLAGFMRARKHRYDLFGALVLTLLPAVGGGTLRDILIGRHPLYIFTDPSYIAVVGLVVLGGTLLTRILPEDISETSGFAKRLLIFDTIGLATFSVIGAEVALLAGLPWWWAAICSAMTCAGGGVLLDVVTGNQPRTFQGEPYEELGILGGLMLFGGLTVANHFEHAAWLVPTVILVTFAVVYALRILVVRRHWRSWRLGTPFLTSHRRDVYYQEPE